MAEVPERLDGSAVPWTAMGRLSQDPVFLVMLFCISLVFRDPVGVVAHLGMLSMGMVLYAHERREWSRAFRWKELAILLVACVLVLSVKPTIVTHRLPYDRVFDVPLRDGGIRVFPGWLFFLFYIIPVVGRWLIKEEMSLARQFKVDGKDVLFVGCAWLLIAPVAWCTPARSGSLLLGLQGFYLPGLWEELFFRGLLLHLLLRMFRAAVAIPVSSLLFVAQHSTLLRQCMASCSMVSAGNVLSIAVLGLVLGWLYWRTGKLTVCILVHGAVDGLVPLLHAAGISAQSVDVVSPQLLEQLLYK